MAEPAAGSRPRLTTLVAVWLGGVLVVLVVFLGLVLEGAMAARARQSTVPVGTGATVAVAVLLGLTVLGPTAIALVAHTARRRRAASSFAVLSAVLAVLVLAGLAILSGLPQPDRPAPAPAPPVGCQELSGGPNECPGG